MRKLSFGGDSRRGALALITGTIGAQVVVFLALPFLSRIFTPEDFGFYVFVMALAGIISPAATLRLESAAMLPKETETVRALVWVAFVAVLVISVLSSVTVQILTINGIADLGKYPSAAVWVGTYILTNSLFALLSQLALRNQEYVLVAKRTFTRASVMVVAQLGLGSVLRLSTGLLYGGVAGQLAGMLTMIRTTRNFTRLPQRGHMWLALKRYWRFPIIFAPSAVLNSLGLQAPLLYFTAIFGLAFAGQLGMAERIVAIPITLIGAAVSQVIDAEITKRLREDHGGLLNSYLKFSSVLAIAGAIVALLGLSLGNLVIPWLLGEKWAIAGTVVQVLALTSGIRLVASPLSKFIVILQKSLANTLLDIMRVGLMVLAMTYVATTSMAFVPALWLVYSTLSLTYLVTWFYGLWAVRGR